MIFLIKVKTALQDLQPVIDCAKEACLNSKQLKEDHFEEYLEELTHGKGAKKIIQARNYRDTFVI